MSDYYRVPDKLELYGSGEDELEFECWDPYDGRNDVLYDDGYEPEMSREQFSEILAGYEAENRSLKTALLTVCGHYVRTMPGKSSLLAWTVAAMAEYGLVFIPDLSNPRWYAQ